MTQQTAVEWLVQQIGQFLAINKELGMEIIEQAKAMEREQIINAVNSQRQLGWDEKGQQYYNETYGNEQGSK
jgi:hypothetical protein